MKNKTEQDKTRRTRQDKRGQYGGDKIGQDKTAAAVWYYSSCLTSPHLDRLYPDVLVYTLTSLRQFVFNVVDKQTVSIDMCLLLTVFTWLCLLLTVLYL